MREGLHPEGNLVVWDPYIGPGMPQQICNLGDMVWLADPPVADMLGVTHATWRELAEWPGTTLAFDNKKQEVLVEFNVTMLGKHVHTYHAWRAWGLRQGLLWSMSADEVWAPGEPMETHKRPIWTAGKHAGIFAFKTKRHALKHAQESSLAVVGSVYLWGGSHRARTRLPRRVRCDTRH